MGKKEKKLQTEIRVELPVNKDSKRHIVPQSIFRGSHLRKPSFVLC